MSKDSKKEFNDSEFRFSFVLTISDSENKSENIIICKRGFNIYNFDEESLYSLELKETVDDIVNLIDRDLKSKSRVYTWYNFDENYDSPEFSTPLPKEQQVSFKFKILENESGKTIIEKMWSGDEYPFSVRNSVDLTNKKFKYDNVKNIEMDFNKLIAQKAAADRPDLTTIIIRHISSTCSSYQNKNNKKLMYKQHIPELKYEQICLTNKGFEYAKNKLTPIKIITDDNGFEKEVFEAYTTTYSVGEIEYDLNIKKSK